MGPSLVSVGPPGTVAGVPPTRPQPRGAAPGRGRQSRLSAARTSARRLCLRPERVGATAMRTRTMQRLGRTVSEIGFGAWQIGADWGEVDEEAALETLRAAA